MAEFGIDCGSPSNPGVYSSPTITVGSDNAIYYMKEENGAYFVRRLGEDGVDTLVAGNGVVPDECCRDNDDAHLCRFNYGDVFAAGDGGQATDTCLHYPLSLKAGPDGALYLFTRFGNPGVSWIERIDPSGAITHVAGAIDQTAATNQPGDPTSFYGEMSALFVTSNNRLFFVGRKSPPASNVFQLYEITNDGQLKSWTSSDSSAVRLGVTSASLPESSRNGRNIQDLQALLNISSLSWSPQRQALLLTVQGSPSDHLYALREDGTLSVIAGDYYSPAFSYEIGKQATKFALSTTYAAQLADGRIAIGGTNLGDVFALKQNGPVRRDGDSYVVPSVDASMLYRFSLSGLQLESMALPYRFVTQSFEYDENGFVSAVLDESSNRTSVTRPSVGHVVLTAPFGEITELFDDNGDGYVDRIVYENDPAGGEFQLSMGTGNEQGLLLELTERDGVRHLFTYDEQRRLISDERVSIGAQTLQNAAPFAVDLSSGLPMSRDVTLTSAEGRERRYTYQSLGDKSAVKTRDTKSYRSVTGWDGGSTDMFRYGNGTREVRRPDGTRLFSSLQPFDDTGGFSYAPSTDVLQTESGRRFVSTSTTSVNALDDLYNWSLLTESTTRAPGTSDQALHRTTYNVGTRTETATSAEGRDVITKYDVFGRVTEVTVEGLYPVRYSYDARGRVEAMRVGTGTSERITQYHYDEPRFSPSAIDYADGRSWRFGYDALNRMTSSTDDLENTVGIDYADVALQTNVTPPERGTHVQQFDAAGMMTEYNPPALNGNDTPTLFDYDRDSLSTGITLGDARTLGIGRDEAGRVESISLTAGNQSRSYDPTTQQLKSTTMPNARGAVTTTFSYDGALAMGAAWSGAVNGTVAFDYNNRLEVSEQTVAGERVVFSRDRDGLLTRASVDSNATASLALTRHPGHGAVTATSLGTVSSSVVTTSFGELGSDTVSWTGGGFGQSITERDKVGRVVALTETSNGTSTQYRYDYDEVGRLKEVRRDGALVGAYAYDGQGNRTLVSDGDRSNDVGTYDSQDRLQSLGAVTYTHNDAGQRTSKTVSGATTAYSYDELGNLLKVTLPGGTTIEYAVDAQGRRVGRYENGAQTHGFIYQDALNPVAELNENGSLHALFIYGSKANVPDMIVKGSDVYRVVSDLRGSVRRVVNVSTGQVVQAMDYDAWGRVLSDTNPGFQPFGFAGGLYDPATQLVRFGARDYDPFTGRWTAKDPMIFRDGTNLFAYVNGDPVNRLDPTGLTAIHYDSGSGTVTVDPEDGSLPYQIQGSSGVGNCMNDPTCSGKRNKGPIPEGDYGINSDELDDPNGLYDLLRRLRGDWGDWRVEDRAIPHRS
ncbi:MAG: RHS repeat-associated core domain-containing protein [Polyangiales bacterium]